MEEMREVVGKEIEEEKILNIPQEVEDMERLTQLKNKKKELMERRKALKDSCHWRRVEMKKYKDKPTIPTLPAGAVVTEEWNKEVEAAELRLRKWKKNVEELEGKNRMAAREWNRTQEESDTLQQELTLFEESRPQLRIGWLTSLKHKRLGEEFGRHPGIPPKPTFPKDSTNTDAVQEFRRLTKIYNERRVEHDRIGRAYGEEERRLFQCRLQLLGAGGEEAVTDEDVMTPDSRLQSDRPSAATAVKQEPATRPDTPAQVEFNPSTSPQLPLSKETRNKRGKTKRALPSIDTAPSRTYKRKLFSPRSTRKGIKYDSSENISEAEDATPVKRKAVKMEVTPEGRDSGFVIDNTPSKKTPELKPDTDEEIEDILEVREDQPSPSMTTTTPLVNKKPRLTSRKIVNVNRKTFDITWRTISLPYKLTSGGVRYMMPCGDLGRKGDPHFHCLSCRIKFGLPLCAGRYVCIACSHLQTSKRYRGEMTTAVRNVLAKRSVAVTAAYDNVKNQQKVTVKNPHQPILVNVTGPMHPEASQEEFDQAQAKEVEARDQDVTEIRRLPTHLNTGVYVDVPDGVQVPISMEDVKKRKERERAQIPYIEIDPPTVSTTVKQEDPREEEEEHEDLGAKEDARMVTPGVVVENVILTAVTERVRPANRKRRIVKGVPVPPEVTDLSVVIKKKARISEPESSSEDDTPVSLPPKRVLRTRRRVNYNMDEAEDRMLKEALLLSEVEASRKIGNRSDPVKLNGEVKIPGLKEGVSVNDVTRLSRYTWKSRAAMWKLTGFEVSLERFSNEQDLIRVVEPNSRLALWPRANKSIASYHKYQFKYRSQEAWSTLRATKPRKYYKIKYQYKSFTNPGPFIPYDTCADCLTRSEYEDASTEQPVKILGTVKTPTDIDSGSNMSFSMFDSNYDQEVLKEFERVPNEGVEEIQGEKEGQASQEETTDEKNNNVSQSTSNVTCGVSAKIMLLMCSKIYLQAELKAKQENIQLVDWEETKENIFCEASKVAWLWKNKPFDVTINGEELQTQIVHAVYDLIPLKEVMLKESAAAGVASDTTASVELRGETGCEQEASGQEDATHHAAEVQVDVSSVRAEETTLSAFTQHGDNPAPSTTETRDAVGVSVVPTLAALAQTELLRIALTGPREETSSASQSGTITQPEFTEESQAHTAAPKERQEEESEGSSQSDSGDDSYASVSGGEDDTDLAGLEITGSIPAPTLDTMVSEAIVRVVTRQPATNFGPHSWRRGFTDDVDTPAAGVSPAGTPQPSPPHP